MREIVIVLSASGHLIALLQVIQRMAGKFCDVLKASSRTSRVQLDAFRFDPRRLLERDVVVGDAYVGIVGLAGWGALVVIAAAGTA